MTSWWKALRASVQWLTFVRRLETPFCLIFAKRDLPTLGLGRFENRSLQRACVSGSVNCLTPVVPGFSTAITLNIFSLKIAHQIALSTKAATHVSNSYHMLKVIPYLWPFRVQGRRCLTILPATRRGKPSSKGEETLATPARERVLLRSNLCMVLRVLGFFWEFSSSALELTFHFLSLCDTSFSCAIEMAWSRKCLLMFVLSSMISTHQHGGPQWAPVSVSLPWPLGKVNGQFHVFYAFVLGTQGTHRFQPSRFHQWVFISRSWI